MSRDLANQLHAPTRRQRTLKPCRIWIPVWHFPNLWKLNPLFRKIGTIALFTPPMVLLKAYRGEQRLREICMDLCVQMLPLLPKHALNSVERNLMLMCLKPNKLTLEAECHHTSTAWGVLQTRAGISYTQVTFTAQPMEENLKDWDCSPTNFLMLWL